MKFAVGGELVELVLTSEARETAKKSEDIEDIPVIARDGSLVVKVGQLARYQSSQHPISCYVKAVDVL